MVIAKGRRWEKPRALKTLATGSNVDSKTSYLNIQMKSHFYLHNENPRVKNLEKVSTVFQIVDISLFCLRLLAYYLK